jgi:hypothetical protein
MSTVWERLFFQVLDIHPLSLDLPLSCTIELVPVFFQGIINPFLCAQLLHAVGVGTPFAIATIPIGTKEYFNDFTNPLF